MLILWPLVLPVAFTDIPCLHGAHMSPDVARESAHVGFGPISWADLEVMALKVANRAQWLDIKTQRASIASGGSTIADAFGSEWIVR